MRSLQETEKVAKFVGVAAGVHKFTPTWKVSVTFSIC